MLHPILNRFPHQPLVSLSRVGKYQALEAGAVPPLLRLVDSEDVASCANALRALTCLAQAPSGRAQLIHNLPQLEARLSHTASIIQRAAATTIQVISWTP